MQASLFGGCRSDGSRTVVSQDEPISTCFFGQSSFCNPTIVQAVCCVKLKSSLPLSVVCALGCGFQTGTGAVYNVVKPIARQTRSLAIFGMGGVGCAAIMMAGHLARQAGSVLENIIAVDINDARLDLAKELGATHTVNSTKVNIEGVLNEITNGERIDAAIDCSGAIPVIQQMIKLLGPGGLAVTVGGTPAGASVAVEPTDMLIRAKTYRGCHQGNAYSKEVRVSQFPVLLYAPLTKSSQFLPLLVDLYEQGEFPIQKLQKTFKAADINVAAEEMAKGNVVKPILLWDT